MPDKTPEKKVQFIEAFEGGASGYGTISCVILTEKGDNFRELMVGRRTTSALWLNVTERVSRT
jgi:hypothetical protein